MEERKCNCNEPYDAEYFQGGYPYCPIHDKRKDTATQLPVEVAEEIKLSANAFATGMWPLETNYEARQRAYVESVYKAGATAYATKLQKVEQENAELRRWNDNLKEKATGWRPLLEKVLGEDTLRGTISTQTIEKIKTFLYGE